MAQTPSGSGTISGLVNGTETCSFSNMQITDVAATVKSSDFGTGTATQSGSTINVTYNYNGTSIPPGGSTVPLENPSDLAVTGITVGETVTGTILINDNSNPIEPPKGKRITSGSMTYTNNVRNGSNI